jgi:hypothetical protein
MAVGVPVALDVGGRGETSDSTLNDGPDEDVRGTVKAADEAAEEDDAEEVEAEEVDPKDVDDEDDIDGEDDTTDNDATDDDEAGAAAEAVLLAAAQTP